MTRTRRLGAAVGAGLLPVLMTNGPNYVSDFLPCWLLIGIGFGLAVPTAISSATVDLRDEEAATGSAIVSMLLQIGAVVGISTLVAILGVEAGAARLSAYGHAWSVSAAIAFACAFIVLAISPKRSASS